MGSSQSYDMNTLPPVFVPPNEPGLTVQERPATAFKKVRCYSRDCIATLVIPEGAQVVIPSKEKCVEYGGGHYAACIKSVQTVADKFRANKALVVSIDQIDGGNPQAHRQCFSKYDKSFKYSEGQTVTPDKQFNSDPSKGCESGIHFYADRDKAENH